MDEEYRLLIIDNDMELVKRLAVYLRSNGIEVKAFLEGESALHELGEWMPDLVITEITLPGMDGFAVIENIRKTTDIPIIVLSARARVNEKIRALDLGADDYQLKPSDFGELTARIRAVLRRYRKHALPGGEKHPKGEYVAYSDLVINLTNYAVQYAGRDITMPPKELELLYCLASSPNRVFTREQLLDRIWGYEYEGDARTVDVHMKRIREKIKDHKEWSLATVWGVGYKFETHV